jgi:hypothetical protein
MIKGVNLDLEISGVFEGTKKVSRTIARYVIIMPFKMARPAPSVLSAQPREVFFEIVLRLQPAKLHRTTTIRKMNPKLIKGRKVLDGIYSFRYSVMRG